MSGPGKLVVQDAAGAQRVLAELVMAWANDAETGEPCFILELDAQHTGAKCGCVCPSCGLPLTAVNAAKAEFRRRPHFRHPEGAERSECMVLAARVAVLRQLQEDGWLELPRRRRSATAIGLSGEPYEAWVEVPAEKLHILQVDYRGRAVAVITFDDGRQLRVELTGTPGEINGPLGADGLPVPTIYLGVNDPLLASMEPSEIRRRMRLLPDDLCWRGHWDDIELQARAEAEAKEKAHFYFDEIPEGLDLPEEMDPALRRETVLHHEVKRILAEQRWLYVPGLDVVVEALTHDGQALRERWSCEAEKLELDHVELEQRFGRIVPDITCKSWSTAGGRVMWPLLIEVTVTNQINEERLRGIREHGEAALEIDLSLAGGRVTRDELTRLVVEELSLKRWLFHPGSEEKRLELRAAVAQEKSVLDEQARWLAERRELVLATPIAEIAREYLAAVVSMLDAGAEADAEGRQSAVVIIAEQAARERVADAADKLALHGYPEAADQNLIGYHGILSRILSCQLARPVGYRMPNVMGVLNAIRQSRGVQRSLFTLFFIAVRVYRPPLEPDQQIWFEGWATDVRNSIRAGDATYLRDPAYDAFLSVLFPEMAEALAKPGGRLLPNADPLEQPGGRTSETPEVPRRRRATFVDQQPRTGGASWPLLDTARGDFWLRGRDLEAWKKANPLWAAAWPECPPRADEARRDK
ncbi:hypothetical protein SAMN05518669_1354 [Variovorax sp. YR634]|uniref:hypothetical protein n=1 Tax=Variovorax sp. YR634 TaxID=1884385 RepID=UPI00089D5B8F|nr:hypothetical protein [Variovorax sp. YR634]SDZ43122.1 hypothetical protein SAMN05518669_1354 [Variovorax sp. YR634]